MKKRNPWRPFKHGVRLENGNLPDIEQWYTGQADRLGISKAELKRMALEFYKQHTESQKT